MLYDLANKHGKVVGLLNTLLAQVISSPATPSCFTTSPTSTARLWGCSTPCWPRSSPAPPRRHALRPRQQARQGCGAAQHPAGPGHLQPRHAVMLYDLANKHGKVVGLLNTLLAQVISSP